MSIQRIKGMPQNTEITGKTFFNVQCNDVRYVAENPAKYSATGENRRKIKPGPPNRMYDFIQSLRRQS
jgi:hypothetical protein